MLQMISWADYIKMVAFGLVLYYGYVAVKFFPRELAGLRMGSRKKQGVEADDLEEVEEEEGIEDAENEKKGDDGDAGKKGDQRGRLERPDTGRPAKEGRGVNGSPVGRVGPPKAETGAVRAPPAEEFRLTGGPEIGYVGDPPGGVIANGEEPAPGGHDTNLVSIAQALSGEIKQLVELAAREKMVKGELIYSLQVLLDWERYRVMKKGIYKETLNNLIRFELEMKCSIHLDAEELNGLWVR